MAMEEKSRIRSVNRWLAEPACWTALFAACYLAVLPMAGTIALRNVALLGLLACLLWQVPKIHTERQWALPVLLWAAYLMVFPLFADDHLLAWKSLGGQWGRGLLAMLAGAGVAISLRQQRQGLVFCLGLVSALPSLIHLGLFAWKSWLSSSFVWGYWGRETHQADLGYAAGQAIVLLSVALATGRKSWRSWAVLLLLACVLSTVAAQSRAGLAFGLLGGLLVLVAACWGRLSRRPVHFVAGLAGLVGAGAVVFMLAVQHDARWKEMTSKLAAGWQGDAIQILCEGTSSIAPWVVARYGPGEQADRIISSVGDGDGLRVVALRAGWKLALEHPWGSDGSRQAFQKRLREHCSTPVVQIAHAHNGWLDTVLALGWVGAALYAGVLLYYLIGGLAGLRHPAQGRAWAWVLVALSAFWMTRGLVDSVFRDHMLEMQGFVLACAAMAFRLEVRHGTGSDAAEASS